MTGLRRFRRMGERKVRVLFVEDERAITEAMTPRLRGHGCSIDVVDTLADADAAATAYRYDLILLDRHLPDGDGLGFLRDLRRARNDVPVIMMSAVRSAVPDRVAGLDVGADDYLAKPVDAAELIARMRSVMRRPRAMSNEVLAIGNVEFERDARTVRIGGTTVKIARRELGMRERLIRAQGRIVSREQIEQNAYSFDDSASFNAIDVSIHRLRRILSRHGASVGIHTVRGLGYLLKERVDGAS